MTSVLTAMVLLLMMPAEPASAEAIGPTVETRPVGHGAHVVAANPHSFALTLTIRLDEQASENVRMYPSPRHTVVLPGPMPPRTVARVAPIDRSKPYRWRYQWKARPGDYRVEPDADHVYLLPFPAGEAYELSQGPHGSFSHEGEVAFDFALPVGATVCAARGGRVLEVVEHYREGGQDIALLGRFNFVMIGHDDGTLGGYLHIDHEGGLVERGQIVAAGDPIARAGDTGYGRAPHLHFQVYRPIDGFTADGTPVRFLTESGPTSELAEGVVYRRPPP